MTVDLPKASYSAEEFAAVVGLSPSAIRTEVREGRIAASFFGPKALIPVAEVDRWLASLPTEKK